MLKHITPMLAATLVSGSFGSPAAAQAQPPVNTAANLDFRRAFIQQVEGVPLGGCLSFLQTDELGSPGFIPHLCTAFEGSDPDEFYLIYSSFSDCVRELRTQP